jgi:hypothetical protein
MKEIALEINPHVFQKYFVKYFDTMPADRPMICRLSEPTDIADLLGFMEKGFAGELLLSAKGKDYELGMVSKLKKAVVLYGKDPDHSIVAEAKPTQAEVVLHPNPDFSYVRIKGSWQLRVNKEDKKRTTIGTSRGRAKEIFLRPHTAVGLVKHKSPDELGFMRNQVFDYVWDQFSRAIYETIRRNALNEYVEQKEKKDYFHYVSVGQKVNADDFKHSAPYTSFPAISWYVAFCSDSADGKIMEDFVREQVEKAFPMPAFLHSKISQEEGNNTVNCAFSLMFEMP